jgi:uncharacterized protein YndB with AHSA1/START domain
MSETKKMKTRDIEKTLTIHAPAEAVWDALTRAEEITRWFAPEARAEQGLGGKVWISWGPGMEGETVISAWEPGKHLRQDWPPNESADEKRKAMRLTVDYFLEGKSGETVLRFVHAGFGADADWDEEYDSHVRGWAIFLANLKHYLERRRGVDCAVVTVAMNLDLDRDKTWQKLISDRGPMGKVSLERIGDKVDFALNGGPPIAGEVDVLVQRRDFGLRLANMNDSLLRASLEASTGGTMLYTVLLAYGLPANDVAAFRARWEKALASSFATHLR